jgi:hypothetical protein
MNPKQNLLAVSNLNLYHTVKSSSCLLVFDHW